ncbi:hypothetical protein BPOR_0780g00050 [Botrytis porri]|uniref:Uncharacterized protein n=1 Tax=Botrytis porri TaxID=87229 RepID=A0A4Z1KBB5_9HELO|nr:hypothetical protein BPOR_0780g00050 [Botrytis porri]
MEVKSIELNIVEATSATIRLPSRYHQKILPLPEYEAEKDAVTTRPFPKELEGQRATMTKIQCQNC